MEQFRPFVDKLPDFFKPWGEEMLLKYLDFEGKTTTKMFWNTILVQFLAYVAFFFLSCIPFVGLIIGLISGLFYLLTIIPMIAIQVRRLRDAGKAWQYIFLCLTCVGIIPLIIFYTQPSVEQ